MNIRILNKTFELLCLALLSLPAIAQQATINANHVLGQPGKSIIDTGMLYKWPHVLDGHPLISPDGNYVAYIIYNQPLHNNTLIIQAPRNSWKKEVITNNIDDYFFSKDNRKLYWKDADTLFFLVLGQDKLDYIAPIISFNLPRFKKGEWIAYQLKNVPGELVVRNLATGKELRLSAVTDYVFNDPGNALLVTTSTKVDSMATTALQWISLSEGKAVTIWTARDGQKAGSYHFDKQGDQLAFMVQAQSGSASSNSIWYYKAGMGKAILKVNSQSPSVSNDSLFISSAAQFSGNGKWLFFGVQEPEEERKPEPGAVKVDIWSYKDRVLYPQQPANVIKERQGVVAVSNSAFIYIIREDEQLETPVPGRITGDYIVVRNHKQAPRWWPLLPPPSYWLVSLKDGARVLLKKESKYPVGGFSFSPGGKWLIYWDSEQTGYISYDIQHGQSISITRSIPLVSREADYYPRPVDEPAGWYAGDEALFIYDRYDIWKLDPAGQHPPVNITNGYGAKHHIELRLVYGKNEIEQPIVYSGKEPILLTGFNTLNKYNGFFMKHLAEKGDPALLTMGPYTYYIVESQKPHEYTFGDGMQPVKGAEGNNQGWIVQRSSATEFPNYFFSDDLIHYRALTDLQPQKKYNWLTAELVTWKQLDGSMSQGILYKPENFDPKKKYPVIFNYYIMLSHRLYGFPWPALTDSNIDIAWFVSRGYLVFTPDIHFSTASSKGGKIPGEAAYNSIESAALYLSKLPYVNGKKMALQGHSFGGGLTNYLVTRSKLFAAACSVAGTVSNEISAYLGLVRANGIPPHEFRLYAAESGIDRLGATLWQRPDLYIKASPVFRADQITTPLLIMHNQGDPACDWGQSAELYMALRRLGKKVWMLQYDNEDHSLMNRENALDFTIRLTQFFDHYLNDAPPANWMTEGVPPKLKGIATGYELDMRPGAKP